MATLTLHAIGEQLAALEQLLIETGGEVTPEVEAWFAEYGGLEQAKVDGIAGFLRSQEALAKACKGEAAELGRKARVAEHTITRLKAYVLLELQARKVKDLAGSIWKLCRQANGGQQALTVFEPDVTKVPVRFLRTIPATVVIDDELLRAGLESGNAEIRAEAEQVARLEPRGEHVRVR